MGNARKRRDADCVACKARCCRYMALELGKPTCKRDYDNIRWYLLHRDVWVFVDQHNTWNIAFTSVCENLSKNNGCTDYADRPRICRDYPGSNAFCEYETDESAYKMVFTTCKAFEAYLERKKIDWRFRRLK
ncbi:MAG: YkgJ family cysteine cluster protein [Pseudomonadota bacterium]